VNFIIFLSISLSNVMLRSMDEGIIFEYLYGFPFPYMLLILLWWFFPNGNFVSVAKVCFRLP
jgi:hypothetical protein